MSLNFDYADVATLPNGDDPTHQPLDKQRWHLVGETLVWQSDVVGLGVIDDKTIDRWVQRLTIIQRMDGPLLKWVDGRTAYITRADIEAYKGLRTNVSAKTDIEFLKTLLCPGSIPAVENEDGKPAYVIVHEQAEKYAKGKQE